MFIEIKEPLKVPEAASDSLREKGLLWVIGACFVGNALFLAGSLLFAQVSEARNSPIPETGHLNPAVAGNSDKGAVQTAAEEPAPPEVSALDQIVEASDGPASPFQVSHRKRVRGACEGPTVCTTSMDAAADQAERDRKRLFKPARKKR